MHNEKKLNAKTNMIQRVAMWADIKLEFDNELTISELIKLYTSIFSGKDIDQEYLLIAQPLVIDSDLLKRIVGEMENFANIRPMTFRYGNTSETTIVNYQSEIKKEFKEYSKEIGMDISKMREIHFVKLFHLSFLCLAGKATDDENLKEKIYRKLNRAKSTMHDN
ncbi:hypothetical protein GCM10009433_02950 [Psychroflexus lacisalsi]|uniref:Uncharacterized protein n=2 Tax=Psychroflexus lacisalsi TaxID=503928 RepID=A0ABN1K1N9_9FLAO